MDEHRRAALLGRDPSRARAASGAVAALTLATYLLGQFVGRGLVDASFEHLPLLVGVVVLGLGSVTAASAFWNDGLAVSLAAVFGPTLPWLWLFLGGGSGAPLVDTVPVVLGFAVVTAAVVGTPAYVVGRLARSRVNGEVTTDGEPVVAILVGDENGQAKRTAVLAVALVPAGAATLGVADLLPGTSALSVAFVFFVLGAVSRGPLAGAAVVGFWLAVAAVAAYRGRGLLGSVALLGGPMLGGIGYLYVTTGLSGGGAAVDAALALVAAAIFAVALGVPGYCLGVRVRVVVESNAPDGRPRS